MSMNSSNVSNQCIVFAQRLQIKDGDHRALLDYFKNITGMEILTATELKRVVGVGKLLSTTLLSVFDVELLLELAALLEDCIFAFYSSCFIPTENKHYLSFLMSMGNNLLTKLGDNASCATLDQLARCVWLLLRVCCVASVYCVVEHRDSFVSAWHFYVTKARKKGMKDIPDSFFTHLICLLEEKQLSIDRVDVVVKSRFFQPLKLTCASYDAIDSCLSLSCVVRMYAKCELYLLGKLSSNDVFESLLSSTASLTPCEFVCLKLRMHFFRLLRERKSESVDFTEFGANYVDEFQPLYAGGDFLVETGADQFLRRLTFYTLRDASKLCVLLGYEQLFFDSLLPVICELADDLTYGLDFCSLLWCCGLFELTYCVVLHDVELLKRFGQPDHSLLVLYEIVQLICSLMMTRSDTTKEESAGQLSTLWEKAQSLPADEAHTQFAGCLIDITVADLSMADALPSDFVVLKNNLFPSQAPMAGIQLLQQVCHTMLELSGFGSDVDHFLLALQSGFTGLPLVTLLITLQTQDKIATGLEQLGCAFTALRYINNGLKVADNRCLKFWYAIFAVKLLSLAMRNVTTLEPVQLGNLFHNFCRKCLALDDFTIVGVVSNVIKADQQPTMSDRVDVDLLSSEVAELSLNNDSQTTTVNNRPGKLGSVDRRKATPHCAVKNRQKHHPPTTGLKKLSAVSEKTPSPEKMAVVDRDILRTKAVDFNALIMSTRASRSKRVPKKNELKSILPLVRRKPVAKKSVVSVDEFDFDATARDSPVFDLMDNGATVPGSTNGLLLHSYQLIDVCSSALLAVMSRFKEQNSTLFDGTRRAIFQLVTALVTSINAMLRQDVKPKMIENAQKILILAIKQTEDTIDKLEDRLHQIVISKCFVKEIATLSGRAKHSNSVALKARLRHMTVALKVTSLTCPLDYLPLNTSDRPVVDCFDAAFCDCLSEWLEVLELLKSIDVSALSNCKHGVLLDKVINLYDQYKNYRFYPMFREINELLTLLYLKMDALKASFHLNEAQCIAMRHESDIFETKIKRSIYRHFDNAADFRNCLMTLPCDWTFLICHLMSGRFSNLICFCRIDSNCEPIVTVCLIPTVAPSTMTKMNFQGNGQIFNCFGELELKNKRLFTETRCEKSRLANNSQTSAATSVDAAPDIEWRRKFTMHRKLYDYQMRKLLDFFAEELGISTLLLCGTTLECVKASRILKKRFSDIPISFIQLLLLGYCNEVLNSSKGESLREFIQQSSLGLLCWEKVKKLISAVEKVSNRLKVSVDHENSANVFKPLILLPNMEGHNFPWETVLDQVSCYHFGNQSYVRMASMHYVVGLLPGRKGIADNKMDTYYVVDPMGNLGRTSELFGPLLRRRVDWSGQIGVMPGDGELDYALAEKDLYLYMGHSDGSIGINLDPSVAVKAASFLIGCSSVRCSRIYKSITESHFKHSFATLYYEPVWLTVQMMWRLLFQRSPVVMGCLWTVSDTEIDMYSLALMRLMGGLPLPGNSEEKIDCSADLFDTDFEEVQERLYNQLNPRCRQLVDGVKKFEFSPEMKFIEPDSLKSLLIAVSLCRKFTPFKYLTGCAPVVYGLPPTT